MHFHGQLGKEEGARKVLGSALRDFMWQRRVKGFLSSKSEKGKHSMSLEA